MWSPRAHTAAPALQALAEPGAAALYSEAVRQEHSLGPASSVQKALRALDAQDIIDRYQDEYFFLDPLFAVWVRQRMT